MACFCNHTISWFKEDAVTTFRLFINYFAPSPSVQTDDAQLTFYIYNSASNEWKNPDKSQWQVYASPRLPVHPGGLRKEFSIEQPIDNLWLALVGQVRVMPAPPPTIFVAEPPDVLVPDADAYSFGPPWISLKSLVPGKGTAGNLWNINGQQTRIPDGSDYWKFNNPNQLGTWGIKVVSSAASAS